MRPLSHAIVPRRVLEEIQKHAEAESPNECCGLLIGRDERVHRSMRAHNVEPGATRYLIDPSDQFAAMRAARGEGLNVIGAYHSHPSGRAEPSPADISEGTGDSRFIYLIVSLPAGREEDVLGAYLLTRGSAQRLKLEIEE